MCVLVMTWLVFQFNKKAGVQVVHTVSIRLLLLLACLCYDVVHFIFMFENERCGVRNRVMLL